MVEKKQSKHNSTCLNSFPSLLLSFKSIKYKLFEYWLKNVWWFKLNELISYHWIYTCSMVLRMYHVSNVPNIVIDDQFLKRAHPRFIQPSRVWRCWWLLQNKYFSIDSTLTKRGKRKTFELWRKRKIIFIVHHFPYKKIWIIFDESLNQISSYVVNMQTWLS